VVNALFLAAAIGAGAFVPLLQPGDTVPAIPLVDQAGQSFSFAQLHGNAAVVAFIYTRCPDPRMCPLVSSKFARLQAGIGNAPIRLIELTLDPVFDTPVVLRRYGRAYGEDARRWTLATGAPASVNELAARFGVATQWTRPGTLVHTEAAIVLDPQGRVAQIIDGNAWTVDGMLAAAREASGSAPAPFAHAALWLTAVVESCGGGRGALNVLEAFVLFLAIGGAIALALLRSLRISER
jgi:cytochrome oxidase Cu insertion factor (SCO1/SenC/PrrC family)